MEPPPLSAPPISAAAAAAIQQPQLPASQPPSSHINYPDSVDSSPRSRNADSWEEPPQYPVAGGGGKLRFMCSYGGHIVPRPHDKSLCYVGGDTRIIVADRHTSLSDLSLRLSKTLLAGRSFTLKYQLPNEDLDSLISVSTDEDLENMIDEYDRIISASAGAAKASRLRLFLFPTKPESSSSIESLLENSVKSEDWFLNALNGATSASTKVFSESSSVNCLLGLDDDIGNSNSKDAEAQLEGSYNAKSGGNSGKFSNVQDVHSVPDSPMLENTSSFGSTSSSPSLANLPPIRVHADESSQRVVGIEDQFQQMSVGAGLSSVHPQRQEDGGFTVLTSPPAPPIAAAAVVVAGVPAIVGGEYPNRVFSDDERSDQGGSVGSRKPQQALPQLQPQLVQQSQQLQQRPVGPIDLPSPDSVSSEGSVTNPLSRQRAMGYQEPVVQMQPTSVRVSANQTDPSTGDANSRIQIAQQLQESGYVLSAQFDQHPPMHQHQQFVHAGAHYVHHHPAGAVPMASYYPIYPPQQQHHPHQTLLEQPYPLYYIPARPAQAYNMPVQQPSYSESAGSVPASRPQTPPPAQTMVPPSSAYNVPRSAPTSKPDIAAGAYRTAAGAAPQVVQIPSSQHQPQYVGFPQIHHPSVSMPPTSAATPSYTYEFTEPTHAQLYYTQPLAPQMAAQYQTMTSSPAVVLPESTSQFPADSTKQQMRTTQP